MLINFLTRKIPRIFCKKKSREYFNKKSRGNFYGNFPYFDRIILRVAMSLSREKKIFRFVILFGYFLVGILGDKGLIIGGVFPASFTAITEIPKSSGSSFSNVTFKVQPQTVLIQSLASDPEKGAVFAIIGYQILRYPNFSFWQNDVPKGSVVHDGRTFTIGQIAFDFVSKNMYWSDPHLHWIATAPAYNVNSKLYKVIVHAYRPIGLALDPEDRLMFFSGNGLNVRIEKASLDGQDREVIVHKGLLYVLTLTVDSENNKLYWADYLKHTLEGCDYDGSKRRVIRYLLWTVSVSGLSYHENMLHAVSFSKRLMLAVDVGSGSEVYRRFFPDGQPYSITTYDTETTRSFNDPCLTLNCHHMCVNTRLGPKCICFDGFDLDNNGKNCTADRSWYSRRGFISGNASIFAMHVVQSVTGISDVHYIKPKSNNTIETFTVDATSDTIYFMDSLSNTLKKFDIISRETSILTWLTSATDLTLDWIANLIGWIEPTHSSISSFSINWKTTATIYTGLQQPASLTVDPHNGVLYWICGTSGRSIVHGSWTRHEPKTQISSTHLNNPRSLQYDVNSHRLYWLDNTIIKSATTNGSDIKSHIDTGGATMVFSYKDFFGWLKGKFIYLAETYSTKEDFEIITLENSNDVAVFDSTLQHDKRGTCQILNGGCEEICIPEINGRSCECDIGLQLQPDNSCDSDVLLKDFIVFTDHYHGRILQIDLETGTLVKLPISVGGVLGLAFDKATKTLFYSEGWTNTIGSTTLHGKNRVLNYNIGLDHAANLAIDYSTGNIYYSVHGSVLTYGYIGVVHRTKLLHKTLLNLSLNSVSGDIALHPSKGFIFWTEFFKKSMIGRASMDGINQTFITRNDMKEPTGLTIDFALSRLYWMDLYKDTIESSDLNGENHLVLASESDSAWLMDIVIHGQYLYYTAWHRQFITKIDKTTGLKVNFMSSNPELGRFDELDIYADESRDVSSSCLTKNGFCSTFCFPTPTGRTCGCQDNVTLLSDQLTCEGILRCPTLFSNLNFTDCAPYPGQSCDFKCKAGYRRAVDDTVYCDRIGQWSSPTETLCKEHHSPLEANNTNVMYMYAGASVAGILVVSLVIAGVICLKKRRSVIARGSTPITNSDPNIKFDDSGYDGPFEIGYFGVEYFVIEESMDSPYLTCTNTDE